MALQYESRFVPRDARFKEKEARPQPLLPTLLPPSLARGTGLLRVMWDGAGLDPTLKSHYDPVTPHAVHTAGKVAFSPEFQQIWRCAVGVSTETQPFLGEEITLVLNSMYFPSSNPGLIWGTWELWCPSARIKSQLR